MRNIAKVAFCLLALCHAAAAFALPNYNIVALGFDDVGHTRSDGFRSSSALIMNEVGQVTGYSQRLR